MNQLNNISTPKGRKVFSRRILFFFFCFSSHCFGSGTLVKKNHGSGDKAGQHRKRDYHGERKGWRTEPPQKVQRYDRVAICKISVRKHFLRNILCFRLLR